MGERVTSWHPTAAEVEDIVRELRPLICEMAQRDQQQLARLRSEASGV